MTKNPLFRISLLLACLLLSHFSNADGVITNGTTMRVHAGTYFVEYGDGIIHNGASLRIFGNVTFSGSLSNLGDENGIIVESDANHTGSLIYTWGHPMLTVKRYLTDGRWHMISPPTEGVISHQYYFNDNPKVWLTKYHETDDSYEYIYSLNLPMPRGQGYGYWVDETKSDVIIAIHGELEAESFFLSELSEPSIQWSDGEHGYNLIGNPYSSAIDFDNVDWNFFNMEESIWVWDPATENFKTRNSSGIGSMDNGIIPSSQGFFVRASAVNAGLTIPSSSRIHDHQALYKSNNETIEDLEYMILEIYRENSDIAEDEAWIGFHPFATDTFDNGLDISKLRGNETAPQLYFRAIKQELSCNILSPLNQEAKTAPLLIDAPLDLFYTIHAKELHIPSSTKILLEDLKTGHIQDLCIENTYKFQASPNDLKHRFNIHFNTLSTSIDAVENENVIIRAVGKTIYMDFFGVLTDLDKTIEIYNTQGQILYNGEIPNGNHYQLISNIPTQAIIIKMITPTNIITKKLMLK